MQTNRGNDSNESPAPPRLIAALQQIQSARGFVPSTVDEAVLRAARQHLSPAQRLSPNAFAFSFRWLGFATACLLVCAAAYWFIQASSNRSRAFAREDLNRDGRVDILDAFQLARQLQSGDKPGPTFDLNDDGVVDRRDAETIAAEAVKLEKGGRS
jgi:hypothetical protein